MLSHPCLKDMNPHYSTSPVRFGQACRQIVNEAHAILQDQTRIWGPLGAILWWSTRTVQTNGLCLLPKTRVWSEQVLGRDGGKKPFSPRVSFTHFRQAIIIQVCVIRNTLFLGLLSRWFAACV